MMPAGKLRTYLAISLFILGIVPVGTAKIIYVDVDATGADDGASWADAYNYLQDGLADANSSEKPVEIRVAQGVYTPDSNSLFPDGTGHRQATFRLTNGVTLKGGYAGFGQTDPNTRDIDLHKTVLSGDLADNDIDVSDPLDFYGEPSRADNSFHVVTTGKRYPGSIRRSHISNFDQEPTRARTNIDTDASPVLDGFTISGGHASNAGMHNNMGGGMLNISAKPTVINCTFVHNSVFAGGGGMHNDNSSPTLVNCVFQGNSAGSGSGGGMFNEGSSPTLINCILIGNSAFGNGGGIANFEFSSPKIANCSFSGNSARHGGAIDNRLSNPILTNCAFYRNSAQNTGGGMHNSDNSRPNLASCTFSANSARHAGGGIYTVQGAPNLSNCTFIGNTAPNGGGGGMFNSTSSPTLVNCTFSGNAANYGGGLTSSVESHTTIADSIIWGNTAGSGNEIVLGGSHGVSTATISYSNIKGGIAEALVDAGCALDWGEGNVDVDPCFAEPGYWDPNGTAAEANDDFWINGDYHLKSQAGRYDPESRQWIQDNVTSPCIDAGNPASPIGLELFPNGGIVNMGAYAATSEASKSYFGVPVCETIIAGDINGDCKVDFKDFQLMAFHWLEHR